MNSKTRKIREGLYQYRGMLIERMDERSERYPGDLDYRQWRVTEDPEDYRKLEIWLMTFSTLKDAITKINEI